LTLKQRLRCKPVIYEIVPPRANASRFGAELRGVEMVMQDSRIDAINIPELINRRESGGLVNYSPATIVPEEYALLVKEFREPIVNIIAPRQTRDVFRRRIHKVLSEYGIKDLVLVGKERHNDDLPGPSVLEALDLVREEGRDDVLLGGICIFARETKESKDYGYSSNLEEYRRMWIKASRGCEFFTSQINFDAKAAVEGLALYQGICDKAGASPMTVFLSMAAVPSQSILALLEGLDVFFPPKVRKRMLRAGDMGKESVRIATEIFVEILDSMNRRQIHVPVGLQIEQIGVKSEGLALELLDNVFREFKNS
jgi:5,10-methylenetetrahydrofolate reductase